MVGYDKKTKFACGDCGSSAKIHGFFSNGSPIYDPHMDYNYYPKKDELLKIYHIKCNDCGFEQWS